MNHVHFTLKCRFGGETENMCMNDTWSFDPCSGEWLKLECIGQLPSPRSRHGAAIIGDIMYIYGGKEMEGAVLNDFYALKLTSLFLSSFSLFE